eukprot:6202880-Pleurochrysis_carterae.AAC.1
MARLRDSSSEADGFFDKHTELTASMSALSLKRRQITKKHESASEVMTARVLSSGERKGDA